jgi:O-antigen ligase
MGGRRLALPNLSGVLNKIRLETWFRKGTLFFYLCAVVMVGSLTLGGGAGRGLLSDAILQLLAIPLLLVCLWRLFEVSLTRQMRLALWFCVAIAALPLLQLIPLPPWLWTALPNRQPSVEAFDIIGSAVPWMPISVSPKGTWLSALSLIPPLAVFLSTLLLSYPERRWLSLVVLAVGVLSVFIGFLQVAQGQDSPFRFFEFSNRTEAVGFFANRNHFAALIYCLLVFVLGWIVYYGSAAVRIPPSQKGKQKEREFEYDIGLIVALIASFTVLVILLAGELMARSRAGLGLTIIALFGVFALGLANRSAGFGAMLVNKLLVGAIVLVGIFSLQFAFYRVLDRISDPLSGDRVVMASTTIEAARAYMPLGSGLGTFVPVYAMFEKPEDVQDTYVNRAHNEILEVWLETGVLGLALTVLFVIWLVRRSVEIWRSAPAPGASQLDWSLIRAATIVPALLLAHSLVEFPLRTGAIMAVMAFACALLIESPVGAEATEEAVFQVPGRARHGAKDGLEPVLSFAKRASKPNPQVKTGLKPVLPSARPAPNLQVKTSVAPSHPSSQRWGADIEWPKEWSKAANSPSPEGTGAPPKEQREWPAD